jgi:hypothetical protein
MLTKQERFEYHRMLEQASPRELTQERHDLEYAIDTLSANCEERFDAKWMLRALIEEISARAEVAAYRLKRLAR